MTKPPCGGAKQAARQELSAPLMAELQEWLNAQLAKVSRNHDVAKAINYMLRRWGAFTRFLEDGRVCLSNNAAERSLPETTPTTNGILRS